MCRSECAGWSAPLLVTYGINRFSHDVARMISLYYRGKGWPILFILLCTDLPNCGCNLFSQIFVCLCWGLTSQSTIFQSCWDGVTASWVINQYFRGVKWLAQGHNTAEVGFEPQTSRSGVRHSTTEPPRSPSNIFYPAKVSKSHT